MKLTEKTLESQTLFTGKIIKVKLDTALLENGKQAKREVVEHPGGVCVLALEEDGTTYTVRQFRYPFGRVVEELPAGKLDGPDEDPREAALRELSEEIGAVPDEIIQLGTLMSSPGFTNEVIHGYLARGLHWGGQHLDEDEFLNVVKTPLSELVDKVMSGEMEDGKSAAIILKAWEFLRREKEGQM